MLYAIGAMLQTVGIEPYVSGHPLSMAGRSPGWTALRNRYLTVNPACVITGAIENIDVHHVKPVSLFPELELAWDNLITLRRDVHLLIGHCGNWSLWNENFRECAAALAAAWREARNSNGGKQTP